MGEAGLHALIEVAAAASDFGVGGAGGGLQSLVLGEVLQVRPVQRIIVVPAILTQLTSSSNNQKRQECVAVLSRLGPLVWEAGGLPIVLELLEEGAVDRQLLASVLRTAGPEGEDLLIKIIKYHKNYKVRMAAASVVAHRLGADPRRLQVELRLGPRARLAARPPGHLCTYHGPLNSPIHLNSNKNDTEMVFEQKPWLEVNARDFLASLQRMIALNNEYFTQ
jgi:hypothetical protein